MLSLLILTTLERQEAVEEEVQELHLGPFLVRRFAPFISVSSQATLFLALLER